MTPPVHNLSQRLRALRKQWFKSQQAYANRCHELGVPIIPTVIADWENSRSEIPARLVPFLAHSLKRSGDKKWSTSWFDLRKNEEFYIGDFRNKIPFFRRGHFSKIVRICAY